MKKSPVDLVPTAPAARAAVQPGRKKRGDFDYRPKMFEEVRARGIDTSTNEGAESVDPNKPLTEKQKLFVKAWASGETILSAAVRAGYGSNGTIGYRMCRMPNILRLYEAEKRHYEEASQMTRKKVMDGLLEGIELAKMAGEPASVINGWKTVGQMCGYFEPVKRKVEITMRGQVTIDRMNRLSDAELLKVLHEKVTGELELLEHSDAEED